MAELIDSLRILAGFRSILIHEQSAELVVLQVDGNMLTFRKMPQGYVKLECVPHYGEEKRRALRTFAAALMRGCFEGYKNVKASREAHLRGEPPPPRRKVKLAPDTPLFGYLPPRRP